MRRGFGSGQSPPRALTAAFVCARDQYWSCQQVIRPREHTSPTALESRQRTAPSRMGPSENRRAIGDVTFPKPVEKVIVSARAKTESACAPSIAAAARRAGPPTCQTLEQQMRELDPVALAPDIAQAPDILWKRSSGNTQTPAGPDPRRHVANRSFEASLAPLGNTASEASRAGAGAGHISNVGQILIASESRPRRQIANRRPSRICLGLKDSR